MKRQIKKTILVLLTVCLVLSITTAAVSAKAKENSNPGIVPVKHNDIIYEELSIKWWKWANSIPLSSNPILDETGKNGSIGQSGSVWFLAGSYNEIDVNRTVKIPAGKAIFFPIVNIAAAKDDTPDFNTTPKLLYAVKALIDNVTLKEVTIDSTTLKDKDLDDYRVRSRPFLFTDFPIPNYMGILTKRPTPGASDGYWILLKPLSEGKHTIRLHGKIDSELYGGVHTETDVIYHITVTKRC